MASPGSTMSSVWFTSKVLEQRFRTACSMVTEALEGDAKGADDGLHAAVFEFNKLKSEQAELARLADQYARQQRALKDTESQIGLLLGSIGIHEPRHNMGECLNLAGDLFKNSGKRREELHQKSESWSKSIDAFLATAVDDMQTSKDKYAMARRQLQAAEGTLLRSRSAVVDPAKHARLQLEVDESRKLYQHLSVTLSSKVRLLAHHRNRHLCDSTSQLCESLKAFHSAVWDGWDGWQSFVADETDALEVIEKCYQENVEQKVLTGFHPQVARPAHEPAMDPRTGSSGSPHGLTATNRHEMLKRQTTREFEEVDLQETEHREGVMGMARADGFASRGFAYYESEEDAHALQQGSVELPLQVDASKSSQGSDACAGASADADARGDEVCDGGPPPGFALTINSAQSMYKAVVPCAIPTGGEGYGGGEGGNGWEEHVNEEGGADEGYSTCVDQETWRDGHGRMQGERKWAQKEEVQLLWAEKVEAGGNGSHGGEGSEKSDGSEEEGVGAGVRGRSEMGEGGGKWGQESSSGLVDISEVKEEKLEMGGAEI
jgi:hypothetical protein